MSTLPQEDEVALAGMRIEAGWHSLLLHLLAAEAAGLSSQRVVAGQPRQGIL